MRWRSQKHEIEQSNNETAEPPLEHPFEETSVSVCHGASIMSGDISCSNECASSTTALDQGAVSSECTYESVGALEIQEMCNTNNFVQCGSESDEMYSSESSEEDGDCGNNSDSADTDSDLHCIADIEPLYSEDRMYKNSNNVSLV